MSDDDEEVTPAPYDPAADASDPADEGVDAAPQLEAEDPGDYDGPDREGAGVAEPADDPAPDDAFTTDPGEGA